MSYRDLEINSRARGPLGRFISNHAAAVLAAFGYLYNKALSIALLGYMAHKYLQLVGSQEVREHGMPFLELLYGSVIIGSVAVIAPFLRLMIFPEVAKYAESGQLRKDLYSAEKLTSVSPALLHYWIVTVSCFVVTALSMFGAMQLGK